MLEADGRGGGGGGRALRGPHEPGRRLLLEAAPNGQGQEARTLLGDCSDRRVRQVRALFNVQALKARAPGLNLGDESFIRNGPFRSPMLLGVCCLCFDPGLGSSAYPIAHLPSSGTATALEMTRGRFVRDPAVGDEIGTRSAEGAPVRR